MQIVHLFNTHPPKTTDSHLIAKPCHSSTWMATTKKCFSTSPSNPSNWTWPAWLGIKNRSTESASWPTILLLMCRVAATKPAHSASLKTLQNQGRYHVVFQLRVQASTKGDKHDTRLHIRSFCLLSLLFTMLSKTSDLKRGKVGSCSFSSLHSFDFKRFDLCALGQSLKDRRHTEACVKQMKHGCWLNMFERCFSTLKSSFEVLASIVDKSWNTSWYWLKWSQTTRKMILWGFMRKQHDFRRFP